MNSIIGIKQWLQEHEPAVAAQLKKPASDTQIKNLESTTGIEIPPDYRQLLQTHNGDSDEPGYFGGCQFFLSCENVIKYHRADAKIQPFSHRNYKYIKLKIDEDVLAIDGPVVPYLEHPAWLPIMDMDGRVIRYLDFAPAPGGTPGQVIEVAFDSWSVLADSFCGFLANYHTGLIEAGYKHEFHYGIGASSSDAIPQKGIPAWLNEITSHDPTSYNERDERADWYEEYCPDLSCFDPNGFPLEITFVGLQSYKRSKRDRDFFEIIWEDNENVFVAFVHHKIYDDIPSTIRAYRQKDKAVKLQAKIEKRCESDNCKSNPNWDGDAWLEVTEVSFLGPARGRAEN